MRSIAAGGGVPKGERTRRTSSRDHDVLAHSDKDLLQHLASAVLLGLFLRPTALATAALLLLFTGVLSISLIRGTTAHGCSCLPTTGPLASLPLVT